MHADQKAPAIPPVASQVPQESQQSTAPQAAGRPSASSVADIYATDAGSSAGPAYGSNTGSSAYGGNAYGGRAYGGSAYGGSAYGGSAYGGAYGSGGAAYQSTNPTDAELEAEYGSGGLAQRPPSDPYGPYGGTTVPLDPEEEEIQQIKMDIRGTKNESLGSTRNALRLARETEETATNTMYKLGEQSGA